MEKNFNINQKLFCCHKHKIHEVVLKRVNMFADEDKVKVEYYVSFANSRKEEIIKGFCLFDNIQEAVEFMCNQYEKNYLDKLDYLKGLLKKYEK